MTIKHHLSLLFVCILSGCICCGGPNLTGPGISDDGSEAGGIGGIIGGITGPTGGGDLPAHCKPPLEAYSLTLADCEREGKAIEKYTCISAVALAKGDPKICDRIPTEEFKGACIGVIAQCKMDETICQLLNEDMSLQFTCIQLVAEAKRDITLCEGIENPRYGNPCVTGVAGALGDISMCARIDDKNEKDKCVKAVAIKRMDASMCSGISGSIDYWRQECIMEVSMAAHDMGLCGSLKTDSRAGETKMETCVKNISSGAKGVSICDAVLEESIRDYHCIIPIAVSMKDVTACSKIKDDSRRISCAKKVASSANDATFCEKLTLPADQMRGSYGKNDCLIEVASTAKDARICERITDNKNAKKTCIQEAG